MNDMANRAREVSEDLIGTCRDLNDFATEQEINDPTFCAELDLLAFRCESCGWWSAAEEETQGLTCLECGEENDDG